MLRLYVWTEFEPDHTDGLAFAIARNLEEAKELVQISVGCFKIQNWGVLEIHPLTKPIAISVSGGR